LTNIRECLGSSKHLDGRTTPEERSANVDAEGMRTFIGRFSVQLLYPQNITTHSSVCNKCSAKHFAVKFSICIERRLGWSKLSGLVGAEISVLKGGGCAVSMATYSWNTARMYSSSSYCTAHEQEKAFPSLWRLLLRCWCWTRLTGCWIWGLKCSWTTSWDACPSKGGPVRILP
jgi:hypothetical protein